MADNSSFTNLILGNWGSIHKISQAIQLCAGERVIKNKMQNKLTNQIIMDLHWLYP